MFDLRVVLITRMPGSVIWTGRVLAVTGDIATVRWSDGAISGSRTLFLKVIPEGTPR